MDLVTSRLRREMENMRVNPPAGISCCMRESQTNILDGYIVGPQGSPYEGGLFHVEINIPQNYPFSPPNVIFKTRIYHPNVDESGRICLSLLKLPPTGGWRCALTIETVLASVQFLMKNPNPDDPLVLEIAQELKTNKDRFDFKAQRYTKKYASKDEKSSENGLS